jgi:drug/metabolite transporter (DMT)-like permease
MIAWRGIFGAVGLAVLLLSFPQKQMWRSLKEMGWLGGLFVVQSAAGMMFYLGALRHTSVASVAVIYATAPFLAAGLGWLVMREKPSTSSVYASVAALAGVAVMVGSGGVGGLVGDLLAVGMTVSMAVATVVARNFRSIPILLTACLSSLISGLICLPLGAPLAVSGRDLRWVAVFGLVNFTIGLPIFVMGAQLLPAIETALIASVETPLAPLWVWLAFSETPSAGSVVGGLIVFAAVVVHLSLCRPKAIGAP